LCVQLNSIPDEKYKDLLEEATIYLRAINLQVCESIH